MYKLELESDTLTHQLVPGQTAHCAEKDLLERQEARQIIVDHLNQTGFDTSSLE